MKVALEEVWFLAQGKGGPLSCRPLLVFFLRLVIRRDDGFPLFDKALNRVVCRRLSSEIGPPRFTEIGLLLRWQRFEDDCWRIQSVPVGSQMGVGM